MSNSISTVDAARALKPKLPELIGDQADILGPQIDALLAQADQGQSVSSAIRKLIQTYPAAYDWLIEHLSEGETLGDTPRSIDFSQLPGNIANVSTEVYRCPECGSPHVPYSVGSEVPPCDNHPEPIQRVPWVNE